MTANAVLATDTADTRQIARPAPFGRRVAVGALLVGATLNLAEALLRRQVGVGDAVEGNLDAVAARPGLASATLVVGTLAVPFLLLGFVAMAQLVRPRMPKLGGIAAALGFAGGLGFFGLHALFLVDAAAADQPDRAAMVGLLTDLQTDPLGLLFVVPFLIGIPLSLLLTSIGMLRTRVVHRWIPAALLLFLVLDFGGFTGGPVDPHWLFVAAATGAAVAIARSSERQWTLGTVDAEARPA